MSASRYFEGCPAKRAYPCVRCGRPACAQHGEWDVERPLSRCHNCIASWGKLRWEVFPRLLLFVAVGLLLGIGAAIIFGRAASAAEGALLGAVAGLVLAMRVAHRL